jgi:hypothetical protein
VLYTCVLWKLFEKYFSCSFSSIFQIFFVWSVRTVFRDVRTVLLYVRMVILVVRTIWLICPDVHSSCPDEHVFATSTRHYVRTSLKFRPDGEPCRVKSHSPWRRTSLSPLLLWFFVVLCVFLVIFMHISHVHVSSLHFISSPGMYLYSFTNFFLKVFMLKISLFLSFHFFEFNIYYCPNFFN